MEAYQDTIAAVTLRRGPCFGACPVYEVTLRSDGTADWNGDRFVDRIGRQKGAVDTNEFARLAAFVERAGFFHWGDEYVDPNVTDLPNYFLTVARGEQTKTVRQYGTDVPPDFWVIASLVDGLAERVQWSPLGVCFWRAVRDHRPPGPHVLRVDGACQFDTAGYTVELRRHEPQGINPAILLLDRIVHPPTGPAAQGNSEVPFLYEEVTEVEYEAVTILPDGITVTVDEAQ